MEPRPTATPPSPATAGPVLRGALAPTVLLAVALAAFLFEGLFQEQSLLGLDNRLFPPFLVHRDPGAGPRPTNLLTSDINGFILPETIAQRRAFGEGRAPLWNPWQNLGQPLLADMGHAPFYPTALLDLALDPLRAYAWSMFLHLLFLGVGTWVLFRSRGLDVAPACLGALVMALGGFATVHLHLPNFLRAMAWLPWILLSVDRLLRTPTLRRTALLALQVGCCFLAAFPQITVLVLGLAGCCLVAGLRRAPSGRAGPALGLFALALLVGTALAGSHLFPTLETRAASWRSADLDDARLQQKGLEPESLIGLVLPRFFGHPVQDIAALEQARDLGDFPTARAWLQPDVQNNFIENTLFIGLLPLALVVLACLSRARPGDWFHRWLLLLSLLVALGVPGVRDVGRMVPGFGAGSPKRVLVLAAFALAWLSASGLQHLMASGTRWRRPLVLLAVALAALGLAGFLPFERWWPADLGDTDQEWWRETLRPDLWRCLCAGLALTAVAAWMHSRPRTMVAGLLAFVLAELVLFGRGVNPPQPLAGQYDTTPAIEWLRQQQKEQPGRVASLFTDHLLGGNLGQVFQVPQLGGIAALMDRETGELLRVLDPALLDPADPRVVGAIERPSALRSPLLDLLNVRYLAVSVAGHEFLQQQQDSLPGLRLAYQNEREMLAFYERVPAPQPAFLVERIQVLPDDQTLLQALGDPSLVPTATALLREAPEGLPLESLSQGRWTYERPTPEHIQVRVWTNGPAFLVVSESHAPGWTASRDEQTVPIHRTDHALMGVALPAAGEHTVQLRYLPASFEWGRISSGLALMALLVLALWRRRAHTA